MLILVTLGVEKVFSASPYPSNHSLYQTKPVINKQKNKLPLFIQQLKCFSPSKGKDKTDTILALICCFFLGSTGLHRVLMGGSYLLILWYCLTFGGFFFLLPILDFIRILIEPEHYENNNKFFAAFGAM